jgi:hypothetical protein
MVKKRLSRTQLMYRIVRVAIGLLFIFNVAAMFIDGDDSQRSRDAFNAVQSFLMLLCTYVPGFIERTGKVSVPNVMSITFMCFCLAHFVVGEIGELYIKSKVFDSILHTLSGSMVAILGFSIIRLLNDSEKNDLKLSPLFISIFVVCFSVTIGVLWEIVEFSADAIAGSNMQRYSDSVTREPFLGKDALFDTMKDLMLDMGGALVIAVISYIDLKKKKELTAFKWFIEKKSKLPVIIDDGLRVLNQEQGNEDA